MLVTQGTALPKKAEGMAAQISEGKRQEKREGADWRAARQLLQRARGKSGIRSGQKGQVGGQQVGCRRYRRDAWGPAVRKGQGKLIWGQGLSNPEPLSHVLPGRPVPSIQAAIPCHLFTPTQADSSMSWGL